MRDRGWGQSVCAGEGKGIEQREITEGYWEYNKERGRQAKEEHGQEGRRRRRDR